MSPTKFPRISVNKLAQFATVKSARQREIVHDQKYPTEFKGMYYREASEAVASCLASGLEDLSGPEKAILLLKQQTPDKLGTQRRIASNIGALESFLNMLDDIDLGGATATLGENSQPHLTIHNVQVSVRPELILRGSGKGGKLVGALKVHFPSTYALDEDSAGLVSAVTQEWCKAFKPDDGATFGPYCSVVDVGSKTFFPGVRATVQRMKDVAAACQNYAALWDSM